MKLYYAPGACSLSPHIVLREAGLPFEIEKVDLGKKKTESGADYLQINPKGYVPALVLPDGGLLTEGPAIVQYVADQVPDKALAPAAGSMERYRLQEWLNFVATEIHKGFAPLWSDATPADYKTTLVTTLKQRFTILNEHLAKNAYLMGEAFTVADPYAFTCLNWARYLNIKLDTYRNVIAYLERIAKRPKVQEALKAEGLA